MKKLSTEEAQVKLLTFGMILLAVILLVPLFIIAHYSVKSVDDFIYFQAPEAVWQSTHSFWTLCKTQAAYAWNYWKIWQGTYFSEWLVTVMMGICGDAYYFVGAYLAIGGIVFSELIACRVIFVKVLGADCYRTTIFALTCILMQILLMPNPSEAFYWYCGTGLYTWIYALAVLLVALIVSAACSQNKSKRSIVLKEFGILFLSFAVGSSNFVISILILVLFVGGIFLLWIYKHEKRVLMSINLLFYILCMVFSICAPGNQHRMASAGNTGYSALESIFRALWEAALYLNQWSVLPYIVAGFLLYPIMRGMVKVGKYRYPLPFVVTIVTFGMFAAQFVPNLYSLGITGAGRVQNLYRMTMVLWLYGNEYYWIGWLYRRQQEAGVLTGEGYRKSWLLPGWCVGLVLMVFAMFLWGGTTVTSTSAFFALKRGEAAQYRAEYYERLAVLKDETVEVVEFEPYTTMPYVLFFGDIQKNPDDWVNRSVADVFGKKSVRLIDRKE